ncbi:RNA-binding protein [Pyrodictium delaneyi]|uniref:RNA-binding protein n=1 Tax=Pyrodictium delaneyi TaxID=1273541 RepID=A0A211YQI6_9CREN|nr:RNA-binding protein [Pyrodictium delaneyi]OWJ55184.1 RNA-binding protein [Pyrodictium delaneyi]
MSDTRSDYRILVAEHALGMLESIIRAKKLPIPVNWKKALELHGEVRSTLMQIKFSFMPPTMLAHSEPTKKLQELSRELAAILLPREWLEKTQIDQKTRHTIAEIKYAIRTLYGLPARLSLGDDNDPLYAVDIECVEVLSVAKHPNADNLYITRARGIFTYTIVTNLKDVRKGDLRAAAILPPAELRGQLSEAMYCSRGRIEAGCTVGRRPPVNEVERSEVEKIIYSIVKGR